MYMNIYIYIYIYIYIITADLCTNITTLNLLSLPWCHHAITPSTSLACRDAITLSTYSTSSTY